MDYLQFADQFMSSSQFLIDSTTHYSAPELLARIKSGSRCVRFEYCASVVLASFCVQSDVYLTDSWQLRFFWGLPFSLLSLIAGPWGVPWGPILTARAVWTNLCGGIDVTAEIEASLSEEKIAA